MALNEIFKDGFSLDYAVNSAVESGDLVAVGGLIGVAEKDAYEGRDGNDYTTLRHIGVFEFDGPTTAVTVGAAVYALDAGLATGTKAVQTATSDATLVGYAVKGKAGSGAGKVWVRINN